MSVAATTSAVAERAGRFDWPFITAAVLATALLVGLVLVDGQPAAAALVLSGFALGFLPARLTHVGPVWELVVGVTAAITGALVVVGLGWMARRRAPRLLWNGLPTVPPSPTAGLPNTEETYGRPPGRGQETTPQ